MSSESTLAQMRYEILAEHIHHKVPMAKLARNHNVSIRTLWNWMKSYQEQGINGLGRKTRADKGSRRFISPDLKSDIAGLLAQTPRPSITSVFRQIKSQCMHQGIDPPSYAVVYDIARELSSGRSGEDYIGEGFELVQTVSTEATKEEAESFASEILSEEYLCQMQGDRYQL
ncbi:MAG: helix-turn-helix domain-containing protein [Candidatus Obscuribacterales bacterium]|nr:helix-turn-helix domain-containing protein [Candidatus Obscuribacterales bacterium]